MHVNKSDPRLTLPITGPDLHIDLNLPVTFFFPASAAALVHFLHAGTGLMWRVLGLALGGAFFATGAFLVTENTFKCHDPV